MNTAGNSPSSHGNTPPAVPSPRRQVTLRGLFICTTYFAISSALAAKFGLGIFVLMNGLFLTWLSFRGYLWWMQSNQARLKLYGAGWLLFAVSLGLPALNVKGCGNGPPTTYYGWEVAVSTAGGYEGTYREAESFAREPAKRSAKSAGELGLSLILISLWNLPNLLMLASPLLLYKQQHGRGRILSGLVGCAAVSSWTWGITGSEDVRIGYYVWSSGITAISLAVPPGWRTLLAMAGVGAFWMLCLLFDYFI